MCLIIYAGKNTNKKDAFLEEAIRKAEEFNGDGMGFAVKKHNSNTIYLDKGYIDVDTFIDKIKAAKVGYKDELLVHLRIGNKGAKDAVMCHPFVVSDNEEEIIQLEANTDKMVLAHNGTMYRHAVVNSKFSDTYHFIKNIMSKESVQKFLYDNTDDFDKVMDPHIQSSRLILMKHDQKTILLGKWYKENGFYFSKDYYEEYFPKVVESNIYDWRKYKYGNYGYDPDYDDYWNPPHNEEPEKLNDVIRSFDSNKIRIAALKHEVECPKLDYDRPSIKDDFGYIYNYYLGLYLPEYDLITKYIPAITSDNITHFTISPKKDCKIYGIDKLSNSYSLVRCGASSVTIYDHYYDDEVTIVNSDFYNLFKTTPATDYIDVYADLYKLIINVNASKNNYKKLSKIVDEAIQEDIYYINFKGLSYIDIDAAVIFMSKLKEELGFRKEPHTLLF